MRKLLRSIWIASALLASVSLGHVAAGGPGALEFDRVRTALERLEKSARDPLAVAEQQAAGEPTGRPRLAIARSIATFEAYFDTARAHSEPTQLALLSLARQHAHLGHDATALDYYRRAELSGASRHSDAIEFERLSLLAARADSATSCEAAAEAIVTRAVLRQPDAFGALLRRLESFEADRALAGALVELAAMAGELDAALLLQVAELRQRRGELELADQHYRALLARSGELDDPALARLLRGYADNLFVRGDLAGSEQLYLRYREHDTGLLSAWATYQLAILAAQRGEVEPALSLFRSLCEREEATPWRDDACWLQRIATELHEIDGALLSLGMALPRGQVAR